MYSSQLSPSRFPDGGPCSYCSPWPTVFSAFKAAKPEGRTLAYYSWEFIGSLFPDASVDENKFFRGCNHSAHLKCLEAEEALVNEFVQQIGSSRPPDLSALVLKILDETGHDFCFGGENLDVSSNDFLKAFQFVDKVIGQIDDALEKASMYQDALVFLVSDHGRDESGCNHGRFSVTEQTTWWAVRHKLVILGRLQVSVMNSDTSPTILWAMGIDTPLLWHSPPVRAAFEGLTLSQSSIVGTAAGQSLVQGHAACSEKGPARLSGKYEGVQLVASEQGDMAIHVKVDLIATPIHEDHTLATLRIRVVNCAVDSCSLESKTLAAYECLNQSLAYSTTSEGKLQLITFPSSPDCHNRLVDAGIQLNILDRTDQLAIRAGRSPDLIPHADWFSGRLIVYDAEKDVAARGSPAVTIRMDYLPAFLGITVGLYRKEVHSVQTEFEKSMTKPQPSTEHHQGHPESPPESELESHPEGLAPHVVIFITLFVLVVGILVGQGLAISGIFLCTRPKHVISRNNAGVQLVENRELLGHQAF